MELRDPHRVAEEIRRPERVHPIEEPLDADGDRQDEEVDRVSAMPVHHRGHRAALQVIEAPAGEREVRATQRVLADLGDAEADLSDVEPIAIENVLEYLTAALETPKSAGRILEIGGRDILTYAEMMTGYARVRGLKRWLIAVPVLTPRLSSYWVHLITPIPARIAQPLIKGLGNEVIVHDKSAIRWTQ